MAAADLTRWRTASYSSVNGGACVEVAGGWRSFAVRDSKDPAGPVLAFEAADWSRFVRSLAE
jgi:hypothetical protein